ncbi:hypothetical protein [Desulfosporosinus fructosivorans]
MKISPILASILAISMLLSSTVTAFASGKNVTDTSNVAPPKISAEEQKVNDNRVILIDKMKPYVSLNPVTKQYEFKVTTKNKLTESNINEANALIDIANEKIRDAISKNMTLMVTPENTLKGTLSANTGDIQPLSINTGEYWDYEFCYWGERVFLHHNLVVNLRNYKTTILGSYTAFTSLTLRQALVYIGMVSSYWIGVICLCFAGYAAYTYERICASDVGYGVYCDSYYGINLWEVYSAW